MKKTRGWEIDVKTDGFTKLRYRTGYYLFYQHNDDGKLTYFIEIERERGFATISRVETDYIDGVLLKMSIAVDMCEIYHSDEEIKKYLATGGFVYRENPLYRAAYRSGDEKLKTLIKIYYNALTNEECKLASDFLGYRVLPTLENHNQTYCVDASTISSKVLDQSGYVILHTPYFAMMKKTHKVWRLDPSTKQGVDSAPIESRAISFSEYLALFD